MKILFELVKGLFLFMTIWIGVFFARWDILFNPASYEILKQFLVPGYLLFCGLMIGYIITLAYDNTQDQGYLHNLYAKFFMVGLILWLTLAAIYIVL